MSLRRSSFCVLVLALLACGIWGCGGGGGGISVRVAPPSTSVPANGALTFTAIVSGATPGTSGVTWSIREGATGGSVASSGQYTAPGAGGTYHVVATSTADPAKVGASVVTVGPVEVTTDPPAWTMPVGGTRTFMAAVTGTTLATATVTWSVQEGASGGTISAGGVYIAPSARGVYHVVATSTSDPRKSKSSTVTVQSGDVSGGIR